MTADVDGRAGRPTPPGFVHDALLYDTADELADVTASFLLDGLAADDAAVVATGPRTAALVTEAVEGDPRVLVLSRAEAYRTRTPAAIATFRRLGRQRAVDATGVVRVVGEVDFGPTERDWLEWQRYEAVINHALAALPLWGLCLFDTQNLPEPVLESAIRTHPQLVTAGARGSNPLFGDPARYLRSLPVPREPLEDTPPRLVAEDTSDCIGLRHPVAAALAGLDAPSDLREDFLLAVGEVTSNACRHGQVPVTVRLWTSPDRLVCTVRDRGTGWEDPFAGYGPAHGDDLSRGGMGLWMARQLCDHLDITRDEEGLTVRLTTDLR